MNRLQAPASAAGERVDVYLARALDQPRNRVQRLLRDGLVTSNGVALKPSLRLRGGETIDCLLPPVSPGRPQPEPGPLAVIHEDADLLVVDKPAGLIVHPGSGATGGTLVNRLLHHRPEIAEVGSAARPGIVHRLDVGTSGVLAVACSDRAWRALGRAFAEREVGKVYLAVVRGRPVPSAGTVDLPIGRDPSVRTRMAVARGTRSGRPARSRYRELAGVPDVSLLRIRILTGRTHQIRVHCKAIGHPVVGDPTYGEPRRFIADPSLRRPVRKLARPALHALRLTLPPFAGAPSRSFTSPLPDDLRRLCVACDLERGLPTEALGSPTVQDSVDSSSSPA